MDFEFSADQELLRETVRRFLAARAPITPFVRSMLDDARGTTDEVWTELAGLGVTGLLVPERHGGAGMGMVDAAVVLEELGRAVHPGPFLSSAIGAVSLVLAAGGPREHGFLLPGLATGETVGTVAVLEPGSRYEWRHPSTAATPAGDRWQLHGTKVHVADAAAAGLFLVTAYDGTDLGVFAVDAGDDGITVEPAPGVDGTSKEGTVHLDGAHGWRLGSERADKTPAEAVATALDRIAVGAVVDGVGAAQRALELAVEHGRERIQFDRPIGSFQAVQHLCADMLRAVELARAGGYYACWAADAADARESHRAATIAKAFASDELYRVGATAVQVFGGIGFTWEHDIHLYLKRLMSLQRLGGGSDEHLDELATLVLE